MRHANALGERHEYVEREYVEYVTSRTMRLLRNNKAGGQAIR